MLIMFRVNLIKIFQLIYANKFLFSQPFNLNDDSKTPAHLKSIANYQILHETSRTILSPVLQPKASANIGRFESGPLTR